MMGLLKALVWIAIVFGILVGALRVAAIRWWEVPSDDPELMASIAPQMIGGDWIILWRLTPPGFGDLVMCPDPHDETNVVIGRVAGEGGDRIKIKGADIWVNNRKMATESACAPRMYEIEDPRDGSSIELPCSIEAMGGVKHMRLGSPRQDTFQTEVPDGRVFLLSDNRHMPFDSRHYGSVDVETCKETVIFRLMGPDGLGDVERRFTMID